VRRRANVCGLAEATFAGSFTNIWHSGPCAHSDQSKSVSTHPKRYATSFSALIAIPGLVPGALNTGISTARPRRRSSHSVDVEPDRLGTAKA
jgi:hypothetical protein